MSEKRLELDDPLANRLEELKRKYGSDDANEVLKRELGLVPDEQSPEKYWAYLPDELRNRAREVVELVEDIGEFDRRSEKNGTRDRLAFAATESKATVADVTFSENGFTVRYRSQDGEMKQCGRAYHYSSGSVKYGTVGETHANTEVSEMKSHVRERVSGAYRRWHDQ